MHRLSCLIPHIRELGLLVSELNEEAPILLIILSRFPLNLYRCDLGSGVESRCRSALFQIS